MFVAFDGIDGCGKGTQIELLQKKLESLGESVEVVRSPGTTPLGLELRDLLLHKNGISVPPYSQLLLFAGAISELSELINTRREQCWILGDRWINSSIAYQGQQGVKLPDILDVYNIALKCKPPEVTFWLDVPPQAAIVRLKDKNPDRFESFDTQAIARRQDLYRWCHDNLPWKQVRLDGLQTPEEIHRQVLGHLLFLNPSVLGRYELAQASSS